MRGLALTVALVCSTAVAAAQQHHSTPPPAHAHSAPSRPAGPPVVMPLPPLMPQPAGGLTSGFRYPTRDNRVYAPRRGGRGYSTGGYPIGGYAAGYFYSPDVPSAAAAPAPAPEPTGTLQLSGTPGEAQVFVDGFYVATLDGAEMQRGLTLSAGPHHVELRAPDYTATAFDVRINPNDTTSYRASLDYQRRQASPVRTTAPAGPSKMYVIPNCYVGNVPPQPERLPSGCDVSGVRIVS